MLKVINELPVKKIAMVGFVVAGVVLLATVGKTLAVDAVVAADGSGTFASLQAAIGSAPDNGSGSHILSLRPGRYQGPFLVPKNKTGIRLIGESSATTILTWPWNVNEPQSSNTYQFNPGLVVVGKDFEAENLTIENSSGDHGQALALRCDGDRAVFKNCRITGWQDTLMVNHGRFYFTNCYIAGRVDFIYGSGTAVFDHCEIHSKNGGYVTAANTPEQQPFGLVFLDCKLTGDPVPWKPAPGQKLFEPADPDAYLGRPWRPYASVAFVNCWMDKHIKPAGWHNWGKASNEQTARYVEFQSTGPGANPEARVKWAKPLTAAAAKAYTIENILSGTDGWKPDTQ